MAPTICSRDHSDYGIADVHSRNRVAVGVGVGVGLRGSLETWAHLDIIKEDYTRTLGRIVRG